MQLTEEVFDSIVNRLGEGAGEATGGERRGPRVTLRGRLSLMPCPDGVEGPVGPPLSVPARDLSQGGVRFLLPRRLQLDTRFILMLPNPQPFPTLDEKPMAVLCTVSHWVPLAKDLFAVGGQFVEMLDTSALPSEMFYFEPRVVLPGMAADEPQGRAALELLRKAAC